MNLLKSFKIILSAVLIAVSFSGCMNSANLSDIKNIMMVEGIAIDSENDDFSVTVQTLNTAGISGTELPQGNITVNTSAQGKSVIDAVSSMSKQISKNLFFGQNKIIIFGDKTARSDFYKKLDYFLRSSDSRPDVAVCLSDGDAKDIIESKENDAHIPCENMVYLMKNGQDAGVSAYVFTNDIMNMYYDKTSDLYLPVLKASPSGESVQTAGIGIFDDERLVYVTNNDETMGLLFLMGKIKNCSIEFNSGELGMISVEISSLNVKNHTEIADGNIVFVSDIDTQLVINEIENGVANSLGKEELDNICRRADNEIEDMCRQAFFACRENSSDCLRVGEYLAKDCPETYKEINEKWGDYFSSVLFQVNVDTNLKELSDNTQLN